MKHKKDSDSLKKLVEAFQNAEQKVNDIFQNAREETQFKASIDRQSKINEFILKESTREWAQNELPKAFEEGYKSVNYQNQTPQKSFYNLNDSLTPYIDIGGKIHTTIEGFQDDINKKLDQMQTQGYVTIEQIKNTIMNTVGNIPTIKYQNGAKMPLSKYADMLARTSRIETANGGIIARCKDLERDLVKYQAMPNCCPRCQKFNNKVFSISGRDKRFPYLYGDKGPFCDGYNITHPNCRCEINLFVEEFHEKELNDIIKESNRFTNFSKDDKLFDIYNKQQAYNRRYNSELVEYMQLKTQLGENFPYKNIRAFRRAKRKNSETYQTLKQSTSHYASKSEISEEEIGAIVRYKGGGSYALNEKLYTHQILNEEDKNFVDLLDNALKKLPRVRNQKIIRDLRFINQAQADEYVSKIIKTGRLDTSSFNSFTKDDSAIEDFSVRILIRNANLARDIKNITTFENEVIYERGSKIDLINCFKNEEGQYIIVMEEHNGK